MLQNILTNKNRTEIYRIYGLISKHYAIFLIYYQKLIFEKKKDLMQKSSTNFSIAKLKHLYPNGLFMGLRNIKKKNNISYSDFCLLELQYCLKVYLV